MNKPYPSQGTTSLSLQSFLFIPASTQRDLQDLGEGLHQRRPYLQHQHSIVSGARSLNVLGVLMV